MEPNFETKYYYLKIVSGYIENGQIEGLATINSCAFMKDICRAISEVQGEQGLDAGKDIYPSIRADPVRKK